MAKRNRASNSVMTKKELLLPKMEFLPLDGSKGVYVRELGGRSLLKFREQLKELRKQFGDELNLLQGIELMIDLVLCTVCNADATPYFSSREEVELFVEKSLDQFMAVSNKSMDLSGISSYVKEAKDNLKNDQKPSSTTS